MTNGNVGQGLAPAGWYTVAPRVERWWDGARWTDDAVQRGRRTTVTEVRRIARIVLVLAYALAAIAGLSYIVIVATSGVSAALLLWHLPLLAIAGCLIGALGPGPLLARLPMSGAGASPHPG